MLDQNMRSMRSLLKAVHFDRSITPPLAPPPKKEVRSVSSFDPSIVLTLKETAFGCCI
ncbi:hypothetical protein M407DRAFT_241456 [Tulasnella calospora MUT 4182]|uniref:Uncharacterized protein n=1 Tax=Tulasnella calospora MUT 4182 TaxID=1051891 RepID=A0A0C3QV04_9AGAM|nr:hypothetical protein M407DRAFT_241456 [Tulasnella calospora MUT 4182]